MSATNTPIRIPIDCRGQSSPVPTLHVSRAARDAPRPAVLVVTGDDPELPHDLRLWCLKSGADLVAIEKRGPCYTATVLLPISSAGSPETPASPKRSHTDERQSAASPPPRDPSQTYPPPPPDLHHTVSPSPPPNWGARLLDLRGQPSEIALLRLGQLVVERKHVQFLVDPGPFERQLKAWASAISARVAFAPDGDSLRGWVVLERALESDELVDVEFGRPPFQSPDEGGRNKAVFLVIHGDPESLLGALTLANASAERGMEVEVYFAMQSIRALCARQGMEDPPKGQLLQGFVRWILPEERPTEVFRADPRLDSVTTASRRDQLQDLAALMERAATIGISFVVCATSMRTLGIERADLLALPNLTLGRMTDFAEIARSASLSLVF